MSSCVHKSYFRTHCRSLRIAFLFVDEIGDLQVECEIGLEILLRIDGILWNEVSSRALDSRQGSVNTYVAL